MTGECHVNKDRVSAGNTGSPDSRLAQGFFSLSIIQINQNKALSASVISITVVCIEQYFGIQKISRQPLESGKGIVMQIIYPIAYSSFLEHSYPFYQQIFSFFFFFFFFHNLLQINHDFGILCCYIPWPLLNQLSFLIIVVKIKIVSSASMIFKTLLFS